MPKRRRETSHPEPAILVHGIPVHDHRPETEMQALMESPPGDQPDLAREQLAPLRDILADTILEVLDERELWIFDALFHRQLSLRQLARELSISKTHIARLRDHIRNKLQQALMEDPTIRRHIDGRYHLE